MNGYEFSTRMDATGHAHTTLHAEPFDRRVAFANTHCDKKYFVIFHYRASGIFDLIFFYEISNRSRPLRYLFFFFKFQ